MKSETEPIGYFNGSLIPQRQMALPVVDLGFIHGATVAEQVRTFRGQPFLLEEHFRRWTRGLDLLGIAKPFDLQELESLVQQIVDYNASLLPKSAEQGICFFATPGSPKDPWNDYLPVGQNSIGRSPIVGSSSEGIRDDHNFCIYTYPLATRDHQRKYREGVSLVTTGFADVPGLCWPKDIKVRSRLHYYLAQRQAVQTAPSGSAAYPILLDVNENVSDSSIGSIAAWSSSDGLVVRPATDRYDSISLAFLIQLAESQGLKVTERYIGACEVQQFDELLLVSTPWCVYPVKEVDGAILSGSSSGYPAFSRLMQAWEESVGCHIRIKGDA